MAGFEDCNGTIASASFVSLSKGDVVYEKNKK
jgi:hypothetical protein